MIARELDGEDVVARSGISDSLFRSLTDMWLAIYCNQYTLMGSPPVMSAKVIWDIAFYWGFLGFLYSNGRFVSVADDPGVVPYLDGMIELSNRMQQFFREWAAVETARPSAQFVDLYSPQNFMVTLHTAMMGNRRSSPRASTPTPDCFVKWRVSWSRQSSRRKASCSLKTTSCSKCKRGNETRSCGSSGRSTARNRRASRSAMTGSSAPHLHSNSVEQDDNPCRPARVPICRLWRSAMNPRHVIRARG